MKEVYDSDHLIKLTFSKVGYAYDGVQESNA